MGSFDSELQDLASDASCREGLPGEKCVQIHP